ncbi:MAG: MBL fold metallo-hydrolase [Myxococcota bacterium]
MRIRAIVSMLAFIALGLGFVALAFAAQVWWSMPSPQGRLVRGPHDLVGVYSGRAYSWVVPTDDPKGVVLVDVGSDAQASRILAELRKGERSVRAILITHAHGEQVEGLAAFPDVPVYLGTADRGLLVGDVSPEGWLARFYAASVPLPADLRLIEAEETVTIEGATFVGIPTPGHTPGSVTWWWRDVLFTGGSLMAATPPTPSPSGLNDDDEAALASVEKLLPLDFDALADGRTGVVTTARPQVHWMLGATLDPPTRTLLGGEPTGPPMVERRGLYVEAWIPGSDGHRPGLVVKPDGRATVVRNPALPEDRAFMGRQVVAQGTPLGEDQGRIASDHLTEVQLTLVEGETRGDGRLPHVTDVAQLDALLHQWVVVEGRVVDREAFVAGATFAQGRIKLASQADEASDGSVPVTLSLQSPDPHTVWLGRVIKGAKGPEVAIVYACGSVDGCRDNPFQTALR